MSTCRRAAAAALFALAPACGPQASSPSEASRLVEQGETAPEASPVTLVSADGDGATLAVHVPRADLRSVTLDGRPFTQVRLAGWTNDGAVGAPALPRFVAHLIVPRGTEPVVDVEALTPASTEHLDRDVAFDERVRTHDAVPLAVQDADAYRAVRGDQAVTVTDLGWAGAFKLATVIVEPVRYDAPRQELTTRGNFLVHVRFAPSASLASESAPVGSSAGSVAPRLALNGEAFRSFRDESARVDLVIAHESHRSALARLVAFKRERGREVREHYVSGVTADQVRRIIRDEYAKTTPPSSTLLVGNIDQIPSWRGSSDNTWTDFNYQLLDAGEVPDLALGRVPAHDARELEAFIDKAIKRETESRNNDDVLLTAGRDVSLGCPANVSQVGQRMLPAATSLRLVKRFRSEGATTDQVVQAYNAGPNIVFYDGHGDQQGMQEIPLLISNLQRLTNDKHPIIFDIACLNANWRGGARQRNFAESILLKPGVGAAGILASGGSGYGHDFFQTMGRLMAQGRQELQRSDSLLNEVGQVVLAAKIRHGREDRSFWNYYGDPATTVWEQE